MRISDWSSDVCSSDLKGKTQPVPDFGKPDGSLPTSAVLVEPGIPATLSLGWLRPWRLKDDTIVYNQEKLTDMLALQMINCRLEARARAGASYLQASVTQEDVSRTVDGTFVRIMPVGEDWEAAMNDEIGRGSCRERVCQYV